MGPSLLKPNSIARLTHHVVYLAPHYKSLKFFGGGGGDNIACSWVLIKSTVQEVFRTEGNIFYEFDT